MGFGQGSVGVAWDKGVLGWAALWSTPYHHSVTPWQVVNWVSFWKRYGWILDVARAKVRRGPARAGRESRHVGTLLSACTCVLQDRGSLG